MLIWLLYSLLDVDHVYSHSINDWCTVEYPDRVAFPKLTPNWHMFLAQAIWHDVMHITSPLTRILFDNLRLPLFESSYKSSTDAWRFSHYHGKARSPLWSAMLSVSTHCNFPVTWTVIHLNSSNRGRWPYMCNSTWRSGKEDIECLYTACLDRSKFLDRRNKW